MADDIFSALSDTDLDAYLNDDFESMSDAGLDAVLAFNPETTPTEAPPAEPGSRFMTQGFGGGPQPGSGEAAKAGFQRVGQRLYNGFQQLTSESPEEEKQWADLEEKQRAAFAEIDEGIGVEDAPAVALAVGSLFVPGGQIQSLRTGMGILQGLAARTGGIAFVSALHEFMTGKTEDESRLGEAAKTGALVFGGGKLGGMLGGMAAARATKFIEGVGATAIVGRIGGDMKQRFLGRIGSRMAQHLTGRAPGSPPREVRSAIANAHLSGNTALLKGAELNARAESDVFVPGQKEWKEYFDLVKAFGKQGETKASAAAGISRRGEAQAVAQNLLTGTSRRGPNGEVSIDAQAVLQRWQALRAQPAFREMFGTTSAKGTWAPHKAAKQLDRFVDGIAQIGPKPARPGDKLAELVELFDDRAAEAIAKMTGPQAATSIPKMAAKRRERAAALVSAYAEANDTTPDELYDKLMNGDIFHGMELIEKLTAPISDR